MRFANAHPTALFIAIHFNSGGSDADGIETYTLAPRGVPSMAADGPSLSDLRPCAGNVCDAENMALACATHASLICHSRLYDRGIKRARFVVIRDITIPGVLVEGGFLSNPTDARLIATAQYRQEEAQCIAIAVRNYRNAVNVPPPDLEGHSVVVRDDVQLRPAVSPQPIGEAPVTADAAPAGKIGLDLSLATPTVLLRPEPPAPAPAAPSPSPVVVAPAVPAPAQTAGSRTTLTPIVD